VPCVGTQATFFPSNLVYRCWTAVEPCPCLTLLFPEHTEILDGMAMVGTAHAHNLFDVLGVSQEPLVQTFFSFPFTRSRSLCCPLAPSSPCATEVRRYRARTTEPVVARPSCRFFLQGPRHHDPQNPWPCTFAHEGHAFDPGNLVSLSSVRRRVSLSLPLTRSGPTFVSLCSCSPCVVNRPSCRGVLSARERAAAAAEPCRR
jgi:hypothetical protein